MIKYGWEIDSAELFVTQPSMVFLNCYKLGLYAQ